MDIEQLKEICQNFGYTLEEGKDFYQIKYFRIRQVSKSSSWGIEIPTLEGVFSTIKTEKYLSKAVELVLKKLESHKISEAFDEYYLRQMIEEHEKNDISFT